VTTNSTPTSGTGAKMNVSSSNTTAPGTGMPTNTTAIGSSGSSINNTKGRFSSNGIPGYLSFDRSASETALTDQKLPLDTFTVDALIRRAERGAPTSQTTGYLMHTHTSQCAEAAFFFSKTGQIGMVMAIPDNRGCFGERPTYTLVGPENVPANVWVHVAGVYNTSQLSMYIDGVRVDATPQQLTSSNAVLYNLSIGSYKGGSKYFFDGDIAFLRVWSRTLTSNEVNSLYLGAPCNPSQLLDDVSMVQGLLGYWSVSSSDMNCDRGYWPDLSASS